MTANVGVIGGGIAGMVTALRLAKNGFGVSLIESSDQLGGLGTFFEYEGRYVDRFYHCIMPSDGYLLAIIDELGASDRLYWQHSGMGMVYDSQHYPFNSAVDLLKFSPLSLLQRLRLGAMSLALPHLGNDDALDQTPIRDWLSRLFGRSLWEKFWHPMFTAKFGAHAPDLPALYLTKRLGREKNTGQRGYIDGGLHQLVGELADAIRAEQGTVEMSRPVTRIASAGDGVRVTLSGDDVRDYDYLVSTVPLTVLEKVTDPDIDLGSLPKLDYQGVVNVLLFLDRPLEEYYWTAILNSGTPFDGAVESSALIKKAQYGGKSAVYIMRYTHRESELFQTPDAAIAEEWINEFVRIYTPLGIKRENVVDHRVFKAPFVEPYYPLGYSSLKPAARLGQSPVFLATTAQVYPYITSWNSSIRVAEDVADQLIKSHTGSSDG